MLWVGEVVAEGAFAYGELVEECFCVGGVE